MFLISHPFKPLSNFASKFSAATVVTTLANTANSDIFIFLSFFSSADD